MIDPAAEHDEITAVEAAAMRLLAIREHSRVELQQKLRRRGHDNGRVACVLDDLQQSDLLSDARFVEGYLAQRVRKGYGPLRLRAELAERGAPEALVEHAMQVAGVDWQALLERVAGRKFGPGGPADRREWEKRGRHLRQRGFPLGMVRRYLDGLRRGDGHGDVSE